MENILEMTLEQFCARFGRALAPAQDAGQTGEAPAALAEQAAARLAEKAAAEADETPENYFVLNLETGKLELHFVKSAYDALTDKQREDVRSAFLWGRRSGCWISRAKEPNLWRAERVARSLGLADAGKTGERLTFAEQMDRKAARAEARADRYEARADKAAEHGAALQKPINDMHGDIAFFTQPNINTGAGRAFTSRREKMFAAFDRGMDEFRRSEYWRERAQTARRTAEGSKLHDRDRGFIQRRINEAESSIRALKKNIEDYEAKMPQAEAGTLEIYDRQVTPESLRDQLERWTDRLEQQLDKLGYYQDALDAMGGVQYSQENIFPGYLVKVPVFGVVRVMSTGPKNFRGAVVHTTGSLPFAYAEILDLVKAEKEEAPKAHPFRVGETFEVPGGETHTITKTTDKTVTLQDSKGQAYRVTVLRRAIDGKSKWMLRVGHGWKMDIIYRD